MKQLIFFLTFLFCFLINNVFAQNPNYIENLTISKKDSILDFSFDISPELHSKSLTIRLEIESEKQKWNKNLALKGDIGYTENKSKKHICWIPIQDSIVLNENIKFKVFVNPALEVNKSKHLLKSLLLPGLGDYKARNGSGYIAQSVIAYGSIGLAVKNQMDAKIAYEEYKKELDIKRSEEFYKKTISKRNMSFVSIGIATIVWSVDLILLNRKINKMNKNQDLSDYYRQKKEEYFTYTSKLFFIDTRTDYDLLLEKSHNLFSQKLYYEAKENIEKALLIRPKGDFALKDLQKNVDLEIEKLVLAKNQFDKHITLALHYKELNDFDNAILEYEKAILIYPNRTELEKEILQVKIDKKYALLLNQAKNDLSNKDYENAILKLNEALYLKNTEEVQNLLKECNAILEKIESDKEIAKQKAKDAELAATLTQINKQISLKKYEEALLLCDVALTNFSYSNELFELKKKLISLIENEKIAKAKKEKQEALRQKLISIKRYMETKDFEGAIYQIEIAMSMFPDSQELVKQKEICEKEIENIQLKKYKDLIIQADKHWNNKLYEEAKKHYEDALKIKPNESYPKERIKRIEDMKNEETQGTSLAALYELNKSSVFLIYNSNDKEVSQGSGFFITSSGIAVSNYHVFEGFYKQNSIIITSDGKEYKLKEVLEKNKEKDFIIFSVENPKKIKFKPVKISSNMSKIGENVFAIGNPEGLELTLSNGIISGFRENNQYIQTTTPITHGSSGGPLFNMNGEVVGITTLGMQEGSLFFAINIQLLNLGRWIK